MNRSVEAADETSVRCVRNLRLIGLLSHLDDEVKSSFGASILGSSSCVRL